MKDSYSVVIKRLVTEKSRLLENLQNKSSNPSLAKFKKPKYVFQVASDANRNDIAIAVEEIYKEQGVKVTKVNTLHMKPKKKQRGRFREGATSKFKKAIVTLEEGNLI